MVIIAKGNQTKISVKLLRGTAVLLIGQAGSYAFSFIRNVIIARVLSKGDFGLAAVFSMTISLLEVAGRMSFGQQIIQSKAGASEEFKATSHAFQFMLSTVGACLILSLSYPAALVFKVPHAAWAFAFLAIVPLTKGLEHLDYFCQQREMNYLPAVLCELVPQAVVTLAAWPLAVWLGDFRVIIWVMVGKAVIGMLMTHFLSRHSYRWSWHREYLRGMWLFGWPLLLNGVLIFASQQADQVLVGSCLSLENLASYALALSLVSIPGVIFTQVASSLVLPILSRAQDNPEQFRRHYRSCVEYAGIGAVVLTLPLIIGGEQVVTLLYGQKYAGTGTVMGILGAAAAVRFLRVTPAIASMARADTMNQLYSNIWRAVSLPLGCTVVLLGGGVTLIAACSLLAEVVATVVSFLRLRQRQGLPLRDATGAVSYVFGFLAVGLGLLHFGVSHWSFYLAGAAIGAMVMVSILVAWFAFPGFARMVMGMACPQVIPHPAPKEPRLPA